MFNFGFDKRILYIIIGILVVSSLMSMGTGGILGLLFTLPGVLLAITFHEFAHAYAADKLGDDTPRMQGRLNLNPTSHLDPFGFFMLLFAHIGWGKPVQINPRNFNRDISMDKGQAIVSVAGPLMNFILAIALSFVYCMIYKFAGYVFIDSTVGRVVLEMVSYAIIVNVGLGVFNLIPLPPLDGSKVILPVLPYKAKYWLQNNEQIFYTIFLVL
ncbi:MAG: site-2 protease family protein, partial [Clostridia bacterium]|nr:site-2 protease family protein [Clostridia bacterium]